MSISDNNFSAPLLHHAHTHAKVSVSSRLSALPTCPPCGQLKDPLRPLPACFHPQRTVYAAPPRRLGFDGYPTNHESTPMEPPANPGDGPVELEFTVENLESVSYCYRHLTPEVETSGKLGKFFALLTQWDDAAWPKRERINDVRVT